MRKLKDGWTVYNEFVLVNNAGRREHWVETGCYDCNACTVVMPLSKLVAEGPGLCDGCGAYQGHLY